MKLETAVQWRRLASLRASMAALDLDAVAIVPGSNFQYLTGGRFSSMERPTILLIPGTSSVAHLRENMAAADVELPSDAIAELDQMGA